MKNRSKSKEEIIKTYNEGFTASELSKQFGYSQAYIYNIVRQGNPQTINEPLKQVQNDKQPQNEKQSINSHTFEAKFPIQNSLSLSQQCNLLKKFIGQLVFEKWLEQLPPDFRSPSGSY